MRRIAMIIIAVMLLLMFATGASAAKLCFGLGPCFVVAAPVSPVPGQNKAVRGLGPMAPELRQ